MIVTVLLVFVSHCVFSIDAHGYLFEPIARSSAWMVDPSFKECCSYPNHMEMFCGGIGHQWKVNDGKCSICGEPYDAQVKLFEKGGALYKGKIVKTYTQGQIIDVQVMLSANHKGYFEFRLCNLDASPSADASQECLDQHLLKIAGKDSTRTEDVGIYGSSMISVRVELPKNLACKHCVFQWKYTAANNWGTDPTTGQSGPGLGRENETFMGCSDIAILPNGSPTVPPSVIIPTRPTSPATSRSSTSSSSTQWSQWSSSSQTPQTWWPQPSSTQTPQTWWPQPSSTQTPQTWWPQPSSTQTPQTWWPQPSTTTPISVLPTTSTTERTPLGLTTWTADLFDYEVGDEVMYDGVKYRCVAPHRSFSSAEPGPLTWAWWQPIED